MNYTLPYIFSQLIPLALFGLKVMIEAWVLDAFNFQLRVKNAVEQIPVLPSPFVLEVTGVHSFWNRRDIIRFKRLFTATKRMQWVSRFGGGKRAGRERAFVVGQVRSRMILPPLIRFLQLVLIPSTLTNTSLSQYQCLAKEALTNFENILIFLKDTCPFSSFKCVFRWFPNTPAPQHKWHAGVVVSGIIDRDKKSYLANHFCLRRSKNVFDIWGFQTFCQPLLLINH